MFFTASLVVSWIVWLLFADKRRLRELTPVSMFAILLGLITDVTTRYFPYWQYFSPDVHPIVVDFTDDFGIYPTVTYLFIQWLPKEQTLQNMVSYWFRWTGVAIVIEIIHVQAGYMIHLNGWSYIHSYIADWFLFWLFYQYHRIFVGWSSTGS